MFRLLICIFSFLLASNPLIRAENQLNEPALPQELQDALKVPPPGPPQEIDQFYGEFIKMMVMLSLIIAFLLILLWFVKRMMNSRLEQLNVNSMIKVIERRSLTAKTSLYIIETMDKSYILAESQNGITVLGEGKKTATSYEE